MAPIVNLRTARKRAKRLKAEQDAAANRLAYGRSKIETEPGAGPARQRRGRVSTNTGSKREMGNEIAGR